MRGLFLVVLCAACARPAPASPRVCPPNDAAPIPTERSVLVLGEVARPGTLSVDAAPTLGQALCLAGGATVFASRRVVVRRKYDPTRIVATPVARTDEDYPLQAGDQITVEPICGGY